MSVRLSSRRSHRRTPAPEPLEAYTEHFDAQFSKRNQPEGFRRDLEGLLLPAEQNKTLTALGNSEPNVGIHAPVCRAYSGSSLSQAGTRIPSMSRLELLLQDPLTAMQIGRGVA